MENPIPKTSIEYNDNRISLYSAQKGKCFVTGKELDIDNLYCHHKLLDKDKLNDEYKNLVLLLKEIHQIIHIEDVNVVKSSLEKFKLEEKQIVKFNKLREQLQLNFI